MACGTVQGGTSNRVAQDDEWKSRERSTAAVAGKGSGSRAAFSLNGERHMDGFRQSGAITRDYTPFLLILQGMALQLQGIIRRSF